MMLQAQVLSSTYSVVTRENRECATPIEAAAFRAEFTGRHYCHPNQVRVVGLCGALAIKGQDADHADDSDA